MAAAARRVECRSVPYLLGRGGVLAVALWLLVLLALPSCVDMYDVDKEGYSNLQLDQERPNLPYFVDTNRYSDGFTSSATVEMTSTHFPEYVGALALTSTRYLEYLAYKKSAEEQGVAMAGAGDAKVEDARWALFLKHGNEGVMKLPKPSTTFNVYAAIKWNPSRFAIQEGERYSIVVAGSDSGFSPQFWQDGGIRINAEGYSSHFDAISNCYVALGRCRPHLKKKRRLPSANWMTLVCGIGEFVQPVTDLKDGTEEQVRFLPLSEAVVQQTLFVVGRSLEFRATASGMLICFANDAQTLYWNNLGNLTVTVTRESWPPSNQTVYQQMYLPACDSAFAVYTQTQSDGKGGWIYPSPNAIPCNPNGGGAGWKRENIASATSTTSRYNSGAPPSFYSDRPAWADPLKAPSVANQ